MDPRKPSIDVRLNGTLADLLVRLAADLKTDDATGVMSRALGLLDLALQSKRKGRRICVVDDATGSLTDVVI